MRASALIAAAAAAALAWQAEGLAQLGPNGIQSFIPTPPPAEMEVDLELVLAVDISGSMSYQEQVLQRMGYIDALEHPEVMAAIRGGLTGKIAITVVQWAGVGLHHIVVPWTLVEDEEGARSITGVLRSSPLFELRGTSISDSILFASSLFRDNGFAGFRNVIDVSGDGANNQGMPIQYAREIVLARDVVINGLPIMREGEELGGTGYGLDVYYEDCVIGGPGAFIVAVDGPENFAEAIRRKLVLEIAGLVPEAPAGGIVPVQAVAPRISCLIGERTRGFIP
ncbi:MAG: DUF1194 domain-containing protein [Bauldia sp.]|nr:DUF1194 domain-containing protein [Bauldia sp.]